MVPGIKFKYPIYRDIMSITPELRDVINQHDMIMLDYTNDHVDTTDMLRIHQLFRENELIDKVIFLTSDLQTQSYYRTFPFPRWLFSESHDHKDQPLIPIGRRNYNVSCLNRQPRPHRLYTYWKLTQQTWFDRALVSFLGMRDHNTDQEIDSPDYFSRLDFRNIPRNVIPQLSTIPLYKQAIPDDHPSTFNDHTYNNIAFSDTYLNIITESSVKPGVFLTEKTFKALAAGQLFFIVGNSRSIESLENLGFECFRKDLFHLYDTLDNNWVTRVDLMFDNLNHIHDFIESIYFDNRREIAHNQEYVLSDAFRKTVLDKFKEADLLD